jgi:hypothetical protein
MFLWRVKEKMIKIPAYFTGFSSKSDGSAGLRFATQELTAEQFADLKRDLNNFGWLLFKENDYSTDDLPEEQADEDIKSPSKRLRATLWILSQQEGIRKEDFESYYRQKMEKLIDIVKAKLETND